MVKVISVSDEVYAMLTRFKGSRSFSEVIKNAMEGGKKGDIRQFFGALKDKKRAVEWKKEIYTAREKGWPEER